MITKWLRPFLSHQVRHFSEYQNTFASRAAGRQQLNEFFKYTHPDSLADAPVHISTKNTESIQELNQYLQNLSTTQVQNMEEKRVVFFVKNEAEF